MNFEWDPAKAAGTLRKHRLSFDEAATVVLDSLAVYGPNPDHSVSENRHATFGMSSLGRLIVVAHTYRPGGIRIISARRADRWEAKLYEEG